MASRFLRHGGVAGATHKFRHDLHDHRVDVMGRLVFRWARRAASRMEHMVVRFVHPDDDVGAAGQTRAPAVQIVSYGHLIVAAPLED